MHNGFAGLLLIEFLPLHMHFLYGEWVLHAVFHYLLDILDQHKVILCNLFKMLLNNINRNYWRMVNFDRMIKR